MTSSSTWRRVVSGMTSAALIMGQAVPAAWADSMRATATDGSAAGERQLGLDAGFAYGPGGAGMAEFGPANLPVLGRAVIVEPAVRERRAFTVSTLQSLEPQTADYLRSFADRYGFPLPADRVVALRADLRRLHEAAVSAAGDPPALPFVFIMKEWAPKGPDGRPALSMDRVGTPYHYALVGTGIRWDGGRVVPVDFELAIGLLQLGDPGRQALTRLLAHDLASVQAGAYQDFSEEDRQLINGQLAQAAQRLAPSAWLDDLLQRRQARAGDAAEALRRPEKFDTTMSLGPLLGRTQVSVEVRAAIQAELDGLVSSGQLASASVQSLGDDRIVLETAYAPRIGPDGARLRDPGRDFLVAQAVIRAASSAAAPALVTAGAMRESDAGPSSGLDLRPYPAVASFVAEQVAALLPDAVEVIDASDQARLEREAIEAGEVYLGQDGNLYAFSHPDDTARAEKPTYVASRHAADAGMFNNHRLSGAIEPAVDQRLAGVARGKTLYAVPYMVGPANSPHRDMGVQVTDSRYVVLNLLRLYNEGRATLGRQALEAIGQSDRFMRAVHGTGDLDAVRRTEGPDDDRHFVNFVDERRVKSFGSAYGGNAIIPKKFHSLRQSIYDAVQDGRQGRYWLAEHMLILGVQDLQTGATTYVAGAFPSASGKTNLAMLEPPPALAGRYRVWIVSDDLAHLHIGSDGQLRAINPEHGLFGVVPGTSPRSNPNALRAIGPGTGTLFTNIAVKLVRNAQTGRLEVADRWWEGLTEQPPWADVEAESSTGDEGWHDWTGRRLKDRAADQRAKPWAQANSRFTAPIENTPSWIGHAAKLPAAQQPTDWNHPEGVPVKIILFGARRSDTEPAIRQLPDAVSGIADGFFMIGETTAATTGAVGVLKEDPYAQRSFFSVPEPDYVAHELAVHGALGERAPAFFHVNWFRKDSDGKLLWPGYGENLRLLLWAIDRANGLGDAMPTPVGHVPTLDSLNLNGLDVRPERLAAAFAFNVQEWAQELERRSAWLAKFGSRMPQPVVESHARQVRALAGLLGERWTPPDASGAMSEPVVPPTREQVYSRLEQAYGLRLDGQGIDPDFTQRFLSGRLPGDGAALLEEVRHPMLATQFIGMETLPDQGIVPRTGITDKVAIAAVKETADLRAQLVQDTVARLSGRQILHENFETKGEITGGHFAGAVAGDRGGEVTLTVSDVIEGTTAFVDGRPGASAIQIEGPGAETFGMFTDEARALMVVARIDPALEATVLAVSGAETIEDFLDPKLPVELLLRRIARLNGLPPDTGLSQLHVTVLTAEADDLAQLDRLKKQDGLQVDVIKEGTVQPAIAATLGVRGGPVRVFLRRSGMTEAVFNTLMASAFTADGSISVFRVVSPNVKNGHQQMLHWPSDILLKMQAYRDLSGDFADIRDGRKIFSSRQVMHPIRGAYTFLTTGRTDQGLPWSLPGVARAGDAYAVHSLVFASDADGPGRGALALVRSGYLRTPPAASGAMSEPGSGLRSLRVLYVDAEPMRRGINDTVIRQELAGRLDVDRVEVLAAHTRESAERAIQAAQQDGEHLDLIVAHESAPFMLGLVGALRSPRPGAPEPGREVPAIFLTSLGAGAQPWHRNALALGHTRLLDVGNTVSAESFRRISGELTGVALKPIQPAISGAMADEPRRIILSEDLKPAAPTPVAGRQLRVLMADTQPYYRRAWARALEALRDGYGIAEIQVTHARTSQEAQTYYQSHLLIGQPYDLVLFGHELAGTDGLALARALRAFDPARTPAMIMFAQQADDVLRAVGRGVGIADVFPRLFTEEELLASAASQLRLTRREAPSGDVMAVLQREFPELTGAEFWNAAGGDDRTLIEGLRDTVRLLASQPSMAGLPGITQLADDLQALLDNRPHSTTLAGLLWADFKRGEGLRPMAAAEATISGQNYILIDRTVLEAITQVVRAADARGERELALAGAAQDLVIAYLHERAESVAFSTPMRPVVRQLRGLGLQDLQLFRNPEDYISLLLGEAVGLGIELQALQALDGLYAAGDRLRELSYAQQIDDAVKAARRAAGWPRTATSHFAWRYSRALYELFPNETAAAAFQAAWRDRDTASPAARFFATVMKQSYGMDDGERAFAAAPVILEHLFGPGSRLGRLANGTAAGSGQTAGSMTIPNADTATVRLADQPLEITVAKPVAPGRDVATAEVRFTVRAGSQPTVSEAILRPGAESAGDAAQEILAAVSGLNRLDVAANANAVYMLPRWLRLESGLALPQPVAAVIATERAAADGLVEDVFAERASDVEGVPFRDDRFEVLSGYALRLEPAAGGEARRVGLADQIFAGDRVTVVRLAPRAPGVSDASGAMTDGPLDHMEDIEHAVQQEAQRAVPRLDVQTHLREATAVLAKPDAALAPGDLAWAHGHAWNAINISRSQGSEVYLGALGQDAAYALRMVEQRVRAIASQDGSGAAARGVRADAAKLLGQMESSAEAFLDVAYTGLENGARLARASGNGSFRSRWQARTEQLLRLPVADRAGLLREYRRALTENRNKLEHALNPDTRRDIEAITAVSAATSFPAEELLAVRYLQVFKREAMDAVVRQLSDSVPALDETISPDQLTAAWNGAVDRLIGADNDPQAMGLLPVRLSGAERDPVRWELGLILIRALALRPSTAPREVRLTLNTSRDGQQSIIATSLPSQDQQEIIRLQTRLGLPFHSFETGGGNVPMSLILKKVHGDRVQDPWQDMRQKTAALRGELQRLLEPYRGALGDGSWSAIFERYETAAERPALFAGAMDNLLRQAGVPDAVRARAVPLHQLNQEILVRGQYLVGLTASSPEPVQQLFAQVAFRNGVDIARVFDSLNLDRNILPVIAAFRASGGRVQPVIHYSTGFPVAEYVRLAGTLIEASGDDLDALVIKDAAGLLGPEPAFRLVRALRAAFEARGWRGVPIAIHTHDTRGNRQMTQLYATLANGSEAPIVLDFGVGKGRLSGLFGQPDMRDFLGLVSGTPWQPRGELDAAALADLEAHIQQLVPAERVPAITSEMRRALVEVAKIPGGMYSNFLRDFYDFTRGLPGYRNTIRDLYGIRLLETDRAGKETKQFTAEGRKFAEAVLFLIFEEMAAVRGDLGGDRLSMVTPTSQWVGDQARENVLGRWLSRKGWLEIVRTPDAGITAVRKAAGFPSSDRVAQYQSQMDPAKPPVTWVSIPVQNYLLVWAQDPDLQRLYPDVNRRLVLEAYRQLGDPELDLGAITSALRLDGQGAVDTEALRQALGRFEQIRRATGNAADGLQARPFVDLAVIKVAKAWAQTGRPAGEAAHAALSQLSLVRREPLLVPQTVETLRVWFADYRQTHPGATETDDDFVTWLIFGNVPGDQADGLFARRAAVLEARHDLARRVASDEASLARVDARLERMPEPMTGQIESETKTHTRQTLQDDRRELARRAGASAGELRALDTQLTAMGIDPTRLPAAVPPAEVELGDTGESVSPDASGAMAEAPGTASARVPGQPLEVRVEILRPLPMAPGVSPVKVWLVTDERSGGETPYALVHRAANQSAGELARSFADVVGRLELRLQPETVDAELNRAFSRLSEEGAIWSNQVLDGAVRSLWATASPMAVSARVQAGAPRRFGRALGGALFWEFATIDAAEQRRLDAMLDLDPVDPALRSLGVQYGVMAAPGPMVLLARISYAAPTEALEQITGAIRDGAQRVGVDVPESPTGFVPTIDWAPLALPGDRGFEARYRFLADAIVESYGQPVQFNLRLDAMPVHLDGSETHFVVLPGADPGRSASLSWIKSAVDALSRPDRLGDDVVSGAMAEPQSSLPGAEAHAVTAAGTIREALQRLPFSAEVKQWAADRHPPEAARFAVRHVRGTSQLTLGPGALGIETEPGDQIVVWPDTAARLRAIEQTFRQQSARLTAESFERQLSGGDETSLALLPTFLQRPTGRETGRFIGLDVGGTNIRALLVELSGGRYRVIESASAPWKQDAIDASSSPERFFGAVSAVVRELMSRESVRDLVAPGERVPAGLTFSFPVHQTGLASGTVVNFSKEFEAPGVVGGDPVVMLREALRQDGLEAVDVVALLNDTTGTLLAGAYQRPDTDMGLILGTGTNLAVDDPARGQLINTEAGGFNGVALNAYDRALDAASASPGAHLFEKQVSGLYLGEAARLAIVGMLRGAGGLADALERPDTLPVELMSSLEALSGQPAAAARLLEAELGLPGGSVPADQAGQVIGMIEAVSDRAARMIAAQAAGSARYMDASQRLRREHRVAVDGSVFEHYWRMPERITRHLSDLLGPDAALIRFDLTKDGSGIGAAIAAAVAVQGRRSVPPDASGAMAEPQADGMPPGLFGGSEAVLAGLLVAGQQIDAAEQADDQLAIALSFIDRVPKVTAELEEALRGGARAGARESYALALEAVQGVFQDLEHRELLAQVSPGSRILRRLILADLSQALPGMPPVSPAGSTASHASGAMAEPQHGPAISQASLVAALPFDRQVQALNIRTDGPPGGTHLARGPLANALDARASRLTREQAERAADVSTHRWTVFHSSVFQAMDASAELARHHAELTGALRGADGNWGGQRGTHVAWVMQGAATPEQAESMFAAQLDAINGRLGGLASLRREDVLLLPDTDPDQALRLIESALPGSRVTAVYGPEAFAARFYRDSGEALVPIALPEGGAGAGSLGAGAGVSAGLAASARGGSPDPEFPLPRREDAMFVPPLERVTDPGVEQELRGFRDAVAAVSGDV